MNFLWIALAAFGGGIAAALLGYFDSGNSIRGWWFRRLTWDGDKLWRIGRKRF
jgi:hypothetical protein